MVIIFSRVVVATTTAVYRPYINEAKINIRCPNTTRMPFVMLIIRSVNVITPSLQTRLQGSFSIEKVSGTALQINYNKNTENNKKPKLSYPSPY